VSTSTPRLPPNDLDAEAALLGATMLSTDAADAVLAEGLRSEHFYRSAHGQTFAAIFALHERGEPIDALTVTACLREQGCLDAVGGEAAVARMTADVPSAGNVRGYARIVRDTAINRALLEATFAIQEAIYTGQSSEQTLPLADRSIFDLAIRGHRGGVRNMAEIAWEEIERIEHARAEGLETVGIPTPYPSLNEIIGGLYPMNLVVIAARPGMGKTVAALNIAEHAALKEDKVVLFATLEMSNQELGQRYLADEGDVPHDLLRRARVRREDQLERLMNATKRAMGKKLLVYEGFDLQVPELRAIARKTAVREKGVDLIVVDYLQLLTSGAEGRRRGESRAEEVGGFADGLKNLARELECTVIALSQLNRQLEQRADKRPQLADLRESGGIESAADLVASLYHDYYYRPDQAKQGEHELALLKNRQGPLGDPVALMLHGPHFRFEDIGTKEPTSASSGWAA
jgi:replicative DNA helicase